MAHAENANIKHFKIRITMTLYHRICLDAEAHNMDPSEWARHVLQEREQGIPLTAKDYEKIAELVRKNEAVINNPNKKPRARRK